MSDAKGSRVTLEINSETGSVDLIANGRHVVIHADGRVVIGLIGSALPPPAIRKFPEAAEKEFELSALLMDGLFAEALTLLGQVPAPSRRTARS